MNLQFIILLTAAVLFTAGGCDRKENTTLSKSPVKKGPLIESPSSLEGITNMEAGEGMTIVVPDEVKSKWIYVVIAVDDKQEDKQNEYTVSIGGTFEIPESGLTVNVGPFLPDFQMDGNTITSRSADPKNPAVGVSVAQDGQKIFPATGKWGWIYGNFPKIHPFQHERYALTLKGARFRDGEAE